MQVTFELFHDFIALLKTKQKRGGKIKKKKNPWTLVFVGY